MGEVIEVGNDVDAVKVCEHVVLQCNISCGFRENCERGFTNYCMTTQPEPAGVTTSLPDAHYCTFTSSLKLSNALPSGSTTQQNKETTPRRNEPPKLSLATFALTNFANMIGSYYVTIPGTAARP